MNGMWSKKVHAKVLSVKNTLLITPRESLGIYKNIPTEWDWPPASGEKALRE